MLLIILVLALAPSVSWAQAPQDSWENLKKLDVGHKIKIVDMNLRSWQGKLVSVSDQAMTIRQNEQEVAVERDKVLRVTDLEHSRWARNALLGSLIGMGMGAALSGGSRGTREVHVVTWTMWFGSLGAGVGALVPSHPVIYRVASQPQQTRE